MIPATIIHVIKITIKVPQQETTSPFEKTIAKYEMKHKGKTMDTADYKHVTK